MFYSVISGPHHLDPYSLHQTPVTVPKQFSPYLDGIRIGVDWAWAKRADPAVFKNFESQIHHLEESGAKIVSLDMPELPLVNVGHIDAVF